MSLLRLPLKGKVTPSLRWTIMDMVPRCTASSTSSVPPTAQEAQAAFWEKNERLKRPMSPWMVYKPQITTMLSITHRGTGMGMGLVMYGWGINSLMASHTNWAQTLDSITNTCPHWFLYTIKVGLASSFGYHFVNGIRHLFWDAGMGYDLNRLYQSGYAVMGLTLLITLFAALNA